MKCNVGGMDRVVRIIVGLALVGFAVYSSQLWAYIGIIPLVTGAIGFCPIYPIFKFSSASDKSNK